MNSSRTDVRPAQAQRVRVTSDELIVDLVDGRSVTVPLQWYPRLAHGTVARRRIPARLSRQGLDYRGGSLAGYVLAVGTGLVLIHRVNPMMVLDGYAVWRIADITSIDTSFPSRRFVERALGLRGF